MGSNLVYLGPEYCRSCSIYVGPEQRLRRLVSSVCVLNLNRATPATFRAQIEQ
jgi:hypothetical protein